MSQEPAPGVNCGPHKPPRAPIRRILRIERELRAYRPTFRPPPGPPPMPAEAPAVLAALARSYVPGDRLGLREISEASAVGKDSAAAVRRWAIADGSWPYQAALSGFAARAARRKRREGVTS